MENKEFLGTEKVSKLFVKLAVPTVVAQLVNLLYNMVDRIYLQLDFFKNLLHFFLGNACPQEFVNPCRV